MGRSKLNCFIQFVWYYIASLSTYNAYTTCGSVRWRCRRRHSGMKCEKCLLTFESWRNEFLSISVEHGVKWIMTGTTRRRWVSGGLEAPDILSFKKWISSIDAYAYASAPFQFDQKDSQKGRSVALFILLYSIGNTVPATSTSKSHDPWISNIQMVVALSKCK